jgi:hypothetical protein
MKNIEQAISKIKYALAHPTSIHLDRLDPETLDQLLSIIDKLITPRRIPMKLNIKKSRFAFSQTEKRTFYETVKGSARIHRNRKKYFRPEQKTVREET